MCRSLRATIASLYLGADNRAFEPADAAAGAVGASVVAGSAEVRWRYQLVLAHQLGVYYVQHIHILLKPALLTTH